MITPGTSPEIFLGLLSGFIKKKCLECLQKGDCRRISLNDACKNSTKDYYYLVSLQNASLSINFFEKCYRHFFKDSSRNFSLGLSLVIFNKFILKRGNWFFHIFFRNSFSDSVRDSVEIFFENCSLSFILVFLNVFLQTFIY